MKASHDLRPSPIAGRWYPANPAKLAESVDGYIGSARLPSIEGEIIAVMAPHAGHPYSGPVAGHAFAVLKGLKPRLVALISPMHYPFPQRLLTSAHSGYETPLGPVYIHQGGVRALDEALHSSLGIGLSPVREDPEHSLEIELPFLQRALACDFELLPVMIRDQSPQVARALGDALALVLRERDAILVASTDLSHFFPREAARRLDEEILNRVAALDPQGILDAEEEGIGFACGKGALAAVLWAAKSLGVDSAAILRHATSGDVTGDYDQVVGYAAAVFMRRHA